MVLLLLSAFPAVCHSAGEALLFQVLDASVITGKLAVEIINRVP
jgi:hypothetical protein